MRRWYVKAVCTKGMPFFFFFFTRLLLIWGILSWMFYRLFKFRRFIIRLTKHIPKPSNFLFVIVTCLDWSREGKDITRFTSVWKSYWRRMGNEKERDEILWTRQKEEVEGFKLKDNLEPGIVAYTCNVKDLGDWGRRISWALEFKTILGNKTRHPCLYNSTCIHAYSYTWKITSVDAWVWKQSCVKHQ